MRFYDFEANIPFSHTKPPILDLNSWEIDKILKQFFTMKNLGWSFLLNLMFVGIHSVFHMKNWEFSHFFMFCLGQVPRLIGDRLGSWYTFWLRFVISLRIGIQRRYPMLEFSACSNSCGSNNEMMQFGSICYSISRLVFFHTLACGCLNNKEKSKLRIEVWVLFAGSRQNVIRFPEKSAISCCSYWVRF